MNIHSFHTDQQTLDDLVIFNNNRMRAVYSVDGNSVYDMFYSRASTQGGTKIMKEMFLHPLANVEQINERADVIRYYCETNAPFPFRAAIFNALEFYLDNTDTRVRIRLRNDTLRRRIKHQLGIDTEYVQIHDGILYCIELLNTLHDFLQHSKTDSKNKIIRKLMSDLSTLLKNDNWAWYIDNKGKKKLEYEQVVDYDHVFRFEERGRLKKILYQIYLLDVYITAAKIVKERGFTLAKALPNDKNHLEMKGVFHPFLNQPVPSDLKVDENSNVIFLTGANMAGKSTFMKALGIALFLAHVGFPVPAKEMEFSVRKGIYTSIFLSENADMGYSYFYTEVMRIKKIAQHVHHSQHLVVIFDELFKGTNVKDAYDATLAITEALAGIRNCTFVISTHIIEVGELLKERCNNIKFVYFPTEMDGNKPIYTYQLHEGITNDRHGMLIVRNEKVIDILKGEYNACTLPTPKRKFHKTTIYEKFKTIIDSICIICHCHRESGTK